MLDIKRIKRDLESIKPLMNKRGEKDFSLEEVIELDDKRIELLQEVEALKNEQNKDSKLIPQYKKEGKDTTELMNELRELSDKIKEIDDQVKEVEEDLYYKLIRIPNVPHPDVPVGNTDEDNLEIRKWSEPTKFDFEPKPHWDLGTDLDILSFEAAGKITGSRFTLYKDLGARLERSLINFFLDTHTAQHGYTEVLPPFIANRTSFIGTGQLPKFEEDMFKLEGFEYFLVPTAEVPVTNIHQNEEWSDLYPEFSRIADEEGFPKVAASFRMIVDIEKHHEERYLELAQNVRMEKVFKKNESTLWKCMCCGYIHEAPSAPVICPVCRQPQAYFELYCEKY